MNRLAPSVVATGLAALGLLVTPGAAHAEVSHLSINLGHGWQQDSTDPIFQLDSIAPGWSASRTMLVRNDSGEPAKLAFTADDIVDAENGCNAPESLVDTTCGPDQGELGHAVQFSLTVDPENDGTFEAAPRWAGTLYDITSPRVIDADVPAHGTVGVRIHGILPFATTGNEVQTDRLGFGLRITLEQAGSVSAVEVKGTKTSRPPSGEVLGSLPFTGSRIDRMVASSLWLIIVGVALTLLGRARVARRRGHA